MKRTVTAALALLTLAYMPARGAPGNPSQAQKEAQAKKTPKEQFDALLEEYQKAQTAFSQVYSKAKTDQERSKIFEEKYPKPAEYASRFLAIADSAPEDKAAVSALIWCVQLGGGGADAAKAMRRLAEKHAADPKLASAIPGIGYSYAPVGETLLRAVIEKNQDRTTRGNATMALAQFLKRKIELIRTLNENEKRANELKPFLTAQGFDSEAVARLKSADPASAEKEVESLLEKVEKDFADISSGRGTLGKSARSELNEMRNLGVGKASPEITGSDIDGKSFKLSDYRGKVVVIDFWGDW
jgi:hypothetical protein